MRVAHVPRLHVYLDENVPHSLSDYLAQRNLAVTTAQESQTRSLPDDEQLRFALLHGFVLLTTNVRHFHRWHQTFRTHGWEHGGIITVPQDDQVPQRLHVRSALPIDWADTFATTRNMLFRWVDLQAQMYGGYTFSGYRTDEIDLGLGRASGSLPDEDSMRMRTRLVTVRGVEIVRCGTPVRWQMLPGNRLALPTVW